MNRIVLRVLGHHRRGELHFKYLKAFLGVVGLQLHLKVDIARIQAIDCWHVLLRNFHRTNFTVPVIGSRTVAKK